MEVCSDHVEVPHLHSTERMDELMEASFEQVSSTGMRPANAMRGGLQVGVLLLRPLASAHR